MLLEYFQIGYCYTWYMYLYFYQLVILLVCILSCWRQIFAIFSKLTWATTTYFVCTFTKLSFPA